MSNKTSGTTTTGSLYLVWFQKLASFVNIHLMHVQIIFKHTCTIPFVGVSRENNEETTGMLVKMLK